MGIGALQRQSRIDFSKIKSTAVARTGSDPLMAGRVVLLK